ncbi:MAG: hypothetical protein KDD73_04425 [Anaerolineales bacterium]|nr:hypothetical protein [Anaerolineales bacterium]MCB9126746.1 hypothetical protein [Ardenticatenales bacterium]
MTLPPPEPETVLGPGSSAPQDGVTFRHVWMPFLVSRAMLLLASLIILTFFGQWMAEGAQVERTLPELWSAWDSSYYIEIARDGYGADGNASTLAFFPLYPLLMRWVALGSTDPAVLPAVGVLISNAALALTSLYFYRLVAIDHGEAVAARALWLMLCFPTGFYLSVVYTEGLFLMLAVGAFWAARQRRWWLAAMLAAASAATRSVGLLLIVPLLWEWFRQPVRRAQEGAWLLLIPAGLGAYMLFQAIAFGDPLRFTAAQALWGRSTSLAALADRVRGIVTRLQLVQQGGTLENAGQWLIEFAFVFAALSFMVVMGRKVRASYQFYFLLGLLMPLSTLQFTAMPRLLLVLFPMYIALALALRRPAIFWPVVVLMAVLQLVLFGRWGLGYWVA